MGAHVAAPRVVVLALLGLAASWAAAQSSSEECQASFEGASTAGNCSISACPPSCRESFLKVPVDCYKGLGASVLRGQGNITDPSKAAEKVARCGLSQLLSINDTGLSFDTGASVNTIVQYLVGICVGSIAMSVVFIILMAFPVLLSKSLDAPALLVSKGRTAVAKGGRAAVEKGREAYSEGKKVVAEGAAAGERGWDKLTDTLGGASHRQPTLEAAAGGTAGAGSTPPAATAMEPAPEGSTTKADMAASGTHEGGEQAPVAPAVITLASVPGTPTGAGRTLVAGQPKLGQQGSREGSQLSQLDAEVGAGAPKKRASSALHLVEASSAGLLRTAFVTWAILATLLYCAALALLIVGSIKFVNDTVLSWLAREGDSTSALIAIQWLIIGAVILTGVCDLAAGYIVLAANVAEFGCGRWRVRNHLYNWVNRHGFKVHVFVAGFVILVISISCILFGLGILVITVQLTVQLACSEVSSIEVRGTSVASLCINVPTADTPICGYGVLEACNELTSMQVIMLVLGAALLLWSHIIWLVLLLLSMWRFQRFQVVADVGGEGGPAEAPAGSEHAGSERGAIEGGREGAAAGRVRRGWLRLRGWARRAAP